MKQPCGKTEFLVIHPLDDIRKKVETEAPEAYADDSGRAFLTRALRGYQR